MEEKENIIEQTKISLHDLKQLVPDLAVPYAIDTLENVIKFLESEHKDQKSVKQKSEKSAMQAYLELESWLYDQKDKPIHIKSAMAWGGLFVTYKMGQVDWDNMLHLYGEFMSKQMDLR